MAYCNSLHIVRLFKAESTINTDSVKARQFFRIPMFDQLKIRFHLKKKKNISWFEAKSLQTSLEKCVCVRVIPITVINPEHYYKSPLYFRAFTLFTLGATRGAYTFSRSHTGTLFFSLKVCSWAKIYSNSQTHTTHESQRERDHHEYTCTHVYIRESRRYIARDCAARARAKAAAGRKRIGAGVGEEGEQTHSSTSSERRIYTYTHTN